MTTRQPGLRSTARAARRPTTVPELLSVRCRVGGTGVTVNATDPVNLVGVVVTGTAVPSVRTRRVTYIDGVLEGPEP
jgi:hypothetical protein